MKVGQTVGPFVIEKVVGGGAMGTVYRARYTKTGARVALKLIAPGLADNAQSLARFDREHAILKQLNHPNIVKYYGTGRALEDRTPFYIMEYVDGESLDHVIQRRGRLTWEEVVALGQQLCSALQHAHEHGIIHRDLKPSNLMVLADGTVKLTDFGIAKDMDRTALTADHCTVGTASYMSPEQCRGDRDITPRSDLYSLGVVFYELLTGRKPFHAETPMEMFLQHLNATPERPSRLVLDTPVWLDTLICQMLEKKPEHRPMNAEMVGQALGQVAEKVAAQQSAGVDAVRARAIDRRRDVPRPDEEDKEAARTLRQAVTGKRARRRRKPVYRLVWVQAVGLAGLLAFAVFLLYWSLQPPSPETLYLQTAGFMKSDKPEDWEKAVDYNGPINRFFRYYGDKDVPHAAEMREWADKVSLYEVEEKLKRFVHDHAVEFGLKARPQTEAEKLALSAALAEDAGDLPKARQQWQEVAQQADKDPAARPWGLLAWKERLGPVVQAEALAERVEAALKARKDFTPRNEDEVPLVEAVKCVRGAEGGEARQCWEDLQKKYRADPARRVLVLVAADQLFKLKKAETPAPEKKPKEKS